MSKKKITYRSPVIWNVITFLLFSFLFLYLQNSIQTAKSILQTENLMEFIKGSQVVAGLFLVTIFSIYRMNRLAVFLFWASVGTTFAFTVGGLWIEFSKFIILLLFFYLLFAYYLFQFMTEDFKESYYNPLFDESNLFDPMCFKIPIALKQGDTTFHGHLTNWSENGFFIYLKDAQKLKGKFEVDINFEDHSFKSNARVVTIMKNGNGAGLKVFKDEAQTGLNWYRFVDIIEELGFQPELLV